eukprot:15330165-Ditylum_brightwellii.AAC.1
MHANTSFTDCDARACYDRMVAIVTGLASHKAGIQNINRDQSTQQKSPVHGSGQGAKDAPPEWDNMTTQHNSRQFNLDKIKLMEITHHDIN